MKAWVYVTGWFIFLPFMVRWAEGSKEIALPLGCLAIFLSILGILSFGSGWFGLSLDYKADRPRPENMGTGSASFRYMIGYNNVIRIGSDREGLYLRCWVPFLHPALFIPWTDIEIGEPQRILFRRMQKFLLGEKNRVPFHVDGRTADRLLLPRVQSPEGLPTGAAEEKRERGYVSRS